MRNQLFVAGRWMDSSEKVNVINPHTQICIAAVALADEDMMNEAIQHAYDCRNTYATMSSGEIAEVLTSVMQQMIERQDDFVQLIVAESAKPLMYAKGEVMRAIETFRVAAEEAKRSPSELMDLDWTAVGKGKKGRVEYVSSGVVAGISPFNFPLNLVAHKLAPAIATKSPIILKPSSSTPLTSLLLAEILQQTNLPNGAVSIVPCSRKVGQLLVEDERIAVLSFTGSPDVGWKMKAQAGKKKVVLELGGNAAAIVHKDADLALAIPKLIQGGFAYSGQVCIHTQRIFVHESLYAAFKEQYIAAAKEIVVGAPSEMNTQFSGMIDQKNAVRIEDWLNEAKQAGAKLLLGGERSDLLVMPTIVEGATRGMKIYDEEVFGPVVCIAPYATVEEAIHLVNNSRFGLPAALFTDSHAVIEQCFAELEVGGLILNDATTFRVDQMPYGGVKDSGFGREGVKYAMLDYLEPKLLVY